MLVVGAPLTDQRIFETIADGFASIAHKRFADGEKPADDDEPYMDWQHEDEVWIDRPGGRNTVMSYHQEATQEGIEREEEAWIQYSSSVYILRRAVDGSVTSFRNTNVGDLNHDEEPYTLRREQKVNIQAIVLEELGRLSGE